MQISSAFACEAGTLLVLFVLDGLGPEVNAGPVQLQLHVRRNIATERTDILPNVQHILCPISIRCVYSTIYMQEHMVIL